MKKSIKVSIFIISFIICYFVIHSILKKIDPQPDWGKLSYPVKVVAGKDINITLEYEDIKSSLQLLFVIIYQDSNNLYCGQKNYTDSIPIVRGNGKIHQSLDFNPPDSVFRVVITAQLLQLPPKPGISIYQCKRVGMPVLSEWIYLSKNGSQPQETKLSITNFLKQGYENGYWKKDRGDPTVMGWFITFCYFLTFIISFYLVKKTIPFIKNKNIIWFWYSVTILIILLGINKQLDLQMLFADYARLYAKMSGMFVNRRPFQHKIISLLATMGISVFSIFIYTFWRAPKTIWVALIGFSILFSFPLIRLVSLHRLEALLYKSFLSVRIVDVIEVMGIAIVLSAVFLNYLIYLKSSTALGKKLRF
jgi:hypothetical protein